MSKMVADTSALISLELSGCLSLVIESHTIIAPNAVESELIEISHHTNDELANCAKQILTHIKGKKIRVISVADSKVQKIIQRKVNRGEAECFQLSIDEKTDLFLTDDLAAINQLSKISKEKNITTRISAAAIVALHQDQKISKEKTKEYLLKMVKDRQWKSTTMAYLIETFWKGN